MNDSKNTTESLIPKHEATSMPSRPFKAKYNSTASFSGADVGKGQKVRRWEIDGTESYEPASLSRILGKITDYRGGKVKDAEHALELVKHFGRKNVFFVTSIGRSSVTKKRAKKKWSDAQFKNFIGRHAQLFFLHDRV